jgi:catechol 2,3-dioxygenase-like lactoylglutathione lyase family enzyme
MRTSLDHVFMLVADLPRSVAFYRSLGLQVDEWDGGYVRVHGVDGAFIGMEEGRDEDVGSAGIELVFRVDDVWRAFRTLTGTGIAFEGEPAEQEWGAAHVWLRDPDGYRLSLYSEGPAS